MSKENVTMVGYDFSFNEDETLFVAVSNDGEVFFYDLIAQHRLWSYREKTDENFFIVADIGKNFIAVGGGTREVAARSRRDYTHTIHIFDYFGKLLYKKKIVPRGFMDDYAMPYIKLIDDDRHILIRFGDRVHIYKNEFAK